MTFVVLRAGVELSIGRVAAAIQQSRVRAIRAVGLTAAHSKSVAAIEAVALPAGIGKVI